MVGGQASAEGGLYPPLTTHASKRAELALTIVPIVIIQPNSVAGKLRTIRKAGNHEQCQEAGTGSVLGVDLATFTSHRCFVRADLGQEQATSKKGVLRLSCVPAFLISFGGEYSSEFAEMPGAGAIAPRRV